MRSMRSPGSWRTSWRSRGHRLLVLAPSRSPGLVRDSRKLIRAARERPEALFDPDGGVRVLGVGELLPLQRRGGAQPSPPVDIARTIEEVLTLAPLDFVHVHEPFAPSASVSCAQAQPGAERRLLPRARPSACCRPRWRAASSSCSSAASTPAPPPSRPRAR